jgi:hypothetical protein
MENTSCFVSSLYYGHAENSDFFKRLHKDGEDFPDCEKSDLVFTGIDHPMTEEVRQQLHHFKSHFSEISAVDAGNLALSCQDGWIDALTSLMSLATVPVILGGDIHMARKLSKDSGTKLTSVSMQIFSQMPDDQNQQFSYIGYQRHCCTWKSLKDAEENATDVLSLGKMRTHPHLLEPILRDTEILYIGLDAMRCADAPNVKECLPSGLNAEEYCQILKHAGSSFNLKAVIIGIGADAAQLKHQEYKLLAEGIWYLFEGIQARNNDHPTRHADFDEFVVSLEDYDEELVFLRSQLSYKWWVRFLDNDQSRYISCSHDDYQQSIQSEVPERLIRHMLK